VTGQCVRQTAELAGASRQEPVETPTEHQPRPGHLPTTHRVGVGPRRPGPRADAATTALLGATRCRRGGSVMVVVDGLDGDAGHA